MERPSELIPTSVFIGNVHFNTVASRTSAIKSFMTFLKQLPGRCPRFFKKIGLIILIQTNNVFDKKYSACPFSALYI